jgi:hypothetical protein
VRRAVDEMLLLLLLATSIDEVWKLLTLMLVKPSPLVIPPVDVFREQRRVQRLSGQFTSTWLL